MLSAKLPETELGSCRSFEVGHVAHGDIAISIKDTARPSVPQERTLVMRHGSEVDFMACIVGFYKRIKESGDSPVAKHELPDIPEPEEELEFKYKNVAVDSLRFVLSGMRLPQQDRAEYGWQYLHGPVPPHPGARLTGTVFYTREDLLGVQSLLLTYRSPVINTQTLGTTNEVFFGEFCRDDMPVIARSFLDLSSGEYRTSIDMIMQEAQKGWLADKRADIGSLSDDFFNIT